MASEPNEISRGVVRRPINNCSKTTENKIHQNKKHTYITNYKNTSKKNKKQQQQKWYKWQYKIKSAVTLDYDSCGKQSNATYCD